MTEERIREIICQKFLGGDLSFPIQGDTQLLDEGICDSLGLVQLVAGLEAADPAIRVQDQDITRENFGSINRIMEFLRARRPA